MEKVKSNFLYLIRNGLDYLHYIIPDQISFCSNVFQNFAYVSIIANSTKWELKANGYDFKELRNNLSGTKSRVTKIL